MEKNEQYVLIKRDMFWRPDSSGYTGALCEAGRYSAEDAKNLSRAMEADYQPGYEWEKTYALPLSAAPEFTNKCCPHKARDILLSQKADLLEALEAVEAAWFSDTDEDWLRATRLKDAALAKAYGRE